MSQEQRTLVAAYWALCHAVPLAEGERLPLELAGCLSELSRSAGVVKSGSAPSRLSDSHRLKSVGVTGVGARKVRVRVGRGELAT